MSYEKKNLNKGGISRSGRTSGFDHTYRHPSDGKVSWLLVLAIAAGLLCIALGVTVWADVPHEVVR